MLFSLVIPCFNSHNTIGRLLDSVTRQGIEKDELQVIIVDDASSDKSYLDIVKTYEDRLNIEYCETNVEVHCPGNTRNEGIKHVKGEWLFFADHDDYFEDNALAQVKEYINNLDHQGYVISTIMSSYNEKTQTYTKEFAHKQAWLHGKFYNMPYLVLPYNIRFREDMTTHEDLYFNAAALNALFVLGLDWEYYDIKTYRWVEDENSLTREEGSVGRGYFYENFNDYILCASEPFWDQAKQRIGTEDTRFLHQVLMTFLHCYFYYEGAVYYSHPDLFVDVLNDIINLLNGIVAELKVDIITLINYIYSYPELYYKVRDDCVITTGPFVEEMSFKEFVFFIGFRHGIRTVGRSITVSDHRERYDPNNKKKEPESIHVDLSNASNGTPTVEIKNDEEKDDIKK